MTPKALSWTDIAPLLAEGYGSEDIALRLDVEPSHVRAFIRFARIKGWLDGVYQRGGETTRGAQE